MANFIYDQLVTAQDLNNIAVDLGAGDFSVFTDSSPYAVDKLNEITAALVGSGISSSLNKFEVSVNDNSVTVNTGIAFFESGRKIKFTAPVTLPLQSGELYFEENQSTGNVSLNIGELPIDNYIHLATINEDLTITDKRTIAKAKVTLPAEGNSYYTTRTALMNSYYTDGVLSDGTTEITLPIEGITKIFFSHGTHSQHIFDVSSCTFTGIGREWGEDEPASGGVAYIRHEGNRDRIILTVGTVTDSSISFNVDITPHTNGEDVTIEIYAFGGI